MDLTSKHYRKTCLLFAAVLESEIKPWHARIERTRTSASGPPRRLESAALDHSALQVGTGGRVDMSETMSQPTQQVSDWLAQFGRALSQRDVAAAVVMFDTDSYWRDLVSFTCSKVTGE